jgi:hypothetical protein
MCARGQMNDLLKRLSQQSRIEGRADNLSHFDPGRIRMRRIKQEVLTLANRRRHLQ